MKIVICGSMSVSKQMVEIKKFLERKGHEIVLPRNTERYASRELQSENNMENKIKKIMENQNQYLHEVAITAIVVKDGKFLITRRSPTKRRFPGMWTVPGGKMETSDYLKLPKDTEFYWYNVLERTLKREIKEEVGIDIDNIEYVTSLATVHEDIQNNF
ncbi:MAG: NUDIX domain-containing protein [bacterium]|nr:NUDIX domain-containing protein [bacterium]